MPSAIRYGHEEREDGTRARVVVTSQPYYTHSGAERFVESLPEGSEQRAVANSKLYDAANAAHARIQQANLEYADDAIQGIAEADLLTDTHTEKITEAMEKLRTGVMKPEDAAELFDKVVRKQTELNSKVSAWQAGSVRSVQHYGDPLKYHDELVRNYPALNLRPFVSL